MAAKIKEALDVSGNGSMAIDHRIVRPDGTMRWISARKKVEFSRGSVGVVRRPIKGLLAVLDISDRVEAEEKVRISEIRYRRLFEAAQDGVFSSTRRRRA